MPDGGASFFAWLGSTVLSGTAVGASMIMSSTAWATAATIATAAAVSNYQRQKAKRAAISAYNASLEDRLVMLSTTDGQRSRCYGRVRNVDGILFKATRGTDKEWYTLVVAVAGHEIDGFETVYFGDAPVTLDANGWVTTAPYILTDKPSFGTTGQLSGTGTASISVGTDYLAGSGSAIQPAGDGVAQKTLTVTYSNGVLSISGGDASEAYTASWQTTTNTSNARVRFYTGTATQDLSSVLAADFPDLITSGQHKFAGIACMIVDLRYSPDSYPSGVPSISAVFRGAKVYDPRTASTAWTQNPALIARDWATYAYGGAIGSGDLNNTQIIAAANACDTSTGFVLNGVTTTLPLYRCDIVCQTDADPWTQYEEIIESMAGKTGWSGGLLGMVAGAYRSPVATITEDWLSGMEDIQIVPEPPEDEAVNTYRPKIANAANNWISAPVAEVVGTAYVTADGRTLAREVTLGGVSAEVHAQHICGVLMRDSRESLTVVLPCNMRAFQLELFDVVSVTLSRFGWSAKTFEVMDKQFSLQGGVVLTLKETVAAIFTPNATFTTLSLASNSSLPAFEIVPAMGTISAESGTATLSDGTQVTRARISWTVAANAAITSSGSVEVQYWPQDSALPTGDWITAPAVSGAATSTVITGFKSAVPYLFRARFKNALGVRGAWSTQISHTMSTAPLPASAEWGTLSGRPANLSALSGTEAIQNSQITISGNNISGIGAGNGTAVANTGITLSSAGVLSGAGGGTLNIANIAGAIAATQFASSIEPVGLVSGSTVPTVKTQNTIYLQGTGKLYRWTGTAYTASVATSDLSGTVSDAQIAGLAASKITGELSDSQIAAIAAAKLTGQITSTQITDGAISTPKLAAGSVSTAVLAADAVTADKIAANAVTASEIASEAITTAKLAAGAVTASTIATGAVTAGKIAAGAITATEIAAGTITAGQIAAGAIGASEIASNAITTAKLVVGSVTDAVLGVGTGVNLLYNGDMTAGADYHNKWGSISTVGSYAPLGSGVNHSATWALATVGDPGNNTGYWYTTGSGTYNGSEYTERLSPSVAVKTGSTYIASVYVGAHRTRVDMFLRLYDSAGAYIGAYYPADANSINDDSAGAGGYQGGATLAGYKRLFVKYTVSGSVAQVKIALRKISQQTGVTTNNSYVFYCRAMVEEVGANATAPGPWVPNGYTDNTAVRESNKITSSNVGAYIGSAAIGSAYIGSLTAGNLSVTELSKVVSGGATSGSRIDITSNLIQIYDGTTVRVKLGIF